MLAVPAGQWGDVGGRGWSVPYDHDPAVYPANHERAARGGSSASEMSFSCDHCRCWSGSKCGNARQRATTGGAEDAATAPGTTAEGGRLQEVVVTGSRVVTNGDRAPTPMTVVRPDELAATKPSTVFEQLSELPVFGFQRAPEPRTATSLARWPPILAKISQKY
jgi:hypothetical protein